MYISAQRKGDEVLVWERQSPDSRILKRYPTPYYFYAKDSDGDHTSMYGDSLFKFDDFYNGEHFTKTRRDLINEGVELFESDINPEHKILSEHYYGAKSPELNITYLDIEVDYKQELGFSSPENPYAPINAIAMFHSWTNQYEIIAVPPPNFSGTMGIQPDEYLDMMNDMAPLESRKISINFVSDERSLLLQVIESIKNSDLLSGWNSETFDIPYIVRRLELLDPRSKSDPDGKCDKYSKHICFPEAKSPQWKAIERFGKQIPVVELFGRQHLDYLEIFKKYEVSERRSYKLESISAEVLPDMPKLEYSGTLASLYVDDFDYFIRYNIRDTEILKGFEDKLGYISLSNEMVHISTGEFKHVCGTLKLAELATINYCHYELNGLVVNDNFTPEEVDSFQGAIVLLPQIGKHKHIASIDLTSLYPSVIRSINISPDTLVGQFANNTDDFQKFMDDTDEDITLNYENGDRATKSTSEWKGLFTENKQAVSAYGTVFSQESQGVIPMILTDWFNQRVKYKKKMKDAKTEAEKFKDSDIEKHRDLVQDAAYYDRLQYVYKIKLNSFYGALGNKFFRFYDQRNAASTTATGRQILLHQCAKIAEIMDGEYMLPNRSVEEYDKKTDTTTTFYGYTEDSAIIYGDTDSTYFKTRAKNIDECVEFGDYVADIVNKSFKGFMQDAFICHDGFDDIMAAGREVATGNGIFVDKKRYILRVLDDEGYRTDKLKIMGLELKKTTLPVAITDKLSVFIERYLKDEPWEDIAPDIVELKEYLRNTDDITEIGLPKGIKGIEDYTEEWKKDYNTRLPGHVASSILYNEARLKHNALIDPEIVSGSKIRVYYIRPTIGRFKSVSLPVDIDQVPQWWEDEFLDIIDKDAAIQRLVDDPLLNIVKAVGLDVPSKQKLFARSLFE